MSMSGSQISHLKRRLQEVMQKKLVAAQTAYDKANAKRKTAMTWHEIAKEVLKGEKTFPVDGLKLLGLYAKNHSNYLDERVILKEFPQLEAFDKKVKAIKLQREKDANIPYEEFEKYRLKLQKEMNRIIDTAVFENAEDAFKMIAAFEKF